MSIEIPQPSIALNSHDVPGTKYDMWETWNVPANNTASDIMLKSMILGICADEDMKCLVINCHGNYGKGTNSSGNPKLISTGGFGLSLGQGINLNNVNEFGQIRDMFKCIVIIACGTATVTNPGQHGDGSLLCSEIARAANAYVIAPKTLQLGTKMKLPKNHIDNFEGVVVRYNTSGALDGSSLLGRKLIDEVV